ncbi:site-specific DNA-methyltransferase (plasmid) [Citricoccus nitrophenolicus]
MANRTEELIARITDAELRAALEEDFRAVTGDRKFGLVFERHLPESVRLPGTPIRRGSTVVLRSAKGNENPMRVLKVHRGVATCRPDDDAELVELRTSELVAVARFGEPVFPGLEHVGTAIGPDAVDDEPAHLVIEGENFHALQALEYTHAGKVDLIYIDPPYNTGNKSWIYNDKYVAEEDAFRSSKWLSFMERRLEIARELLSPTGVIFVAIGDDEHHRLRMLMDQVFGPQNFVNNLTWESVKKNSAQFASATTDYMLVYAKSTDSLRSAGVKWRENKPGLTEYMTEAEKAWRASWQDPAKASEVFRQWVSKNKRRFTSSLTNYTLFDGSGRLFMSDNLSNPDPNWDARYDLLHPKTGKPVKMHVNGWRYTRRTMDRMLAEGRIVFGSDHTSRAGYKRYLDEVATEPVSGVFYRARRGASQYLESVLGDKRFPFPKDHEVLMRWIRLAAPKDATILDFFAGSGSTGEAVLRLNAEDGGTRKFILVTNNELNAKDDARLRKQGLEPGDPKYDQLGVFEHVTWPRLKTVLTGVREDGSTYSEGLSGRIEAFKLTYQDPDQVADNLAFKAVSPLLWMMSGTAGKHLDSVGDGAAGPRGWAASGNHVVITDPSRAAEALADLTPEITTVFTVTDSDSEFASVTAMLPSTVESVRLYSHYLGQFLVNRAS